MVNNPSDPEFPVCEGIRRESRLEPSAGLWSFLRSLLIITPSIIVATIVLGSISVFGSFFDSRGDFEQRCSRVWSRLVLLLAGIRLEVEGVDHIRARGPYVLCANHQSYMDIPVLMAALPLEFRFAAKKELFRIPFLGWHLKRAGHIRIDREHPLAAMRALEAAIARIRRGLSVVIFPEGRTSRDGSIAPFKGGAFLMAERSGAALVPITIQGTRQVLPVGSRHIRPGRVTVTIDPPVSSNTMSADETADAVRRTIVDRFSAPRSNTGA